VSEVTEKIVERYVGFVEEILSKYRKLGELIDSENFVTPDRINYALAMWYQCFDGIEAEYQRAKIQHRALSLEFQAWEDQKFEEAKIDVISDYKESKNIKPSLKEFDTRMRKLNREEYLRKKMELEEMDSKVRFLLKQREKLSKYDATLTTMSYNSRSEMKSLSLEDRMNATPEGVSKNKIRSRIPINK
jgi:hypothetical protein